ncbi:MAG TPA: hypothetical protein ENJ94_00265 [Gammaproteobacteria bacterium]|nr:hypothetical protein [Gammaproteobacteria bacterium]
MSCLARCLPICLCLLLPGLAPAAEPPQVDPETGARTWSASAGGVTLSLTQILPDQLRAFYVNRGFTPAQAEPYATSCVFMTVLRNDAAPGPVHFRSADWRVVKDGFERPPLSADHWIERLRAAGVTQPGLIAFRWAQFPAEQTYDPGGDWNQGMLSIGLPPGSRFDLRARWDVRGESGELLLKEVQCAQDDE